MNSTRNLNLIIAVLLIGLVLSLFFNPFSPKPLPVSKDEICMNFSSEMESKLKKGLVSDMVNLYRNNQLLNIQESTARPIPEDANAIWFELDSIKKFIYNFEKTVKNNPSTANSKLGLRIYYAAYPDSILWKKEEYKDLQDFKKGANTSKYGKLHTLVMLPTIQTTDGKIKDVNLFDKSTFTNGITKYEVKNGVSTMPMSERLTSISALLPVPATLTAATSSTSDDIAAKNHGTLYPPGNPSDLGF